MTEQSLHARLDEIPFNGRMPASAPVAAEVPAGYPSAADGQATATYPPHAGRSQPDRAPRRRRRERTGDPARLRYRYAGQVGGEIAGALFWTFFWLINGACTILFLTSLGVPWQVAALAHLVISLIEQHLWRSHRLSAYVLVLLVGSFDVLTSALGVLLFCSWLGLEIQSLTLIALSAILAELIAILPEPLIVDHAIAAWRLLTRR